MGESEAARLSHEIVTSGDGSVVVKLDGELDISTVEQLRDAVAEVIGSAQTCLVIDAEDLRFADSTGLALWVTWSREVPRIEIRNAHPLVLRVIQTMGLSEILNPS